jgi:hypothetical protein
LAEVRASLLPLISRVRREIGDEASSATWTDAEIADALEEYQSIVRYAPLHPYETRLPNGTLQYLDFESGMEWWETDAQVVDGSWDVKTPTSFNWKNGRVSFTTHQVSALYISGKRYDLYAAVENLIDQTIAKLKARALDASDKDSSLKRHQQITTLNDMKRSAQAKQTPGFGRMARSDV